VGGGGFDAMHQCLGQHSLSPTILGAIMMSGYTMMTVLQPHSGTGRVAAGFTVHKCLPDACHVNAAENMLHTRTVCAPCRAASSRDRVNTGRAAPRGSRVNARVHSMYTRAVCTTGLYRMYTEGRK
jgi:hypothetical protein